MKQIAKWITAVIVISGLASLFLFNVNIKQEIQNPQTPTQTTAHQSNPSVHLQDSSRLATQVSDGKKQVEPKVEDKTERERLLEQWFNNLKNTGNPQDAIVHGILSKNKSALWDALALAPSDPLLNYFIAKHCSRYPQEDNCNVDYVAQLAEIDPENALTNLFDAVKAIENKDMNLAISVMNEAADKDHYDNYNFEFYKNISESMVRGGIPRDSSMLVDIIGIESAIVKNEEFVFSKTCKQEPNDRDLHTACVNLANKMLANKSDEFGFAIALGVLKEIQPSEEIFRLDAELQQQHQQIIESANNIDILFAQETPWEISEEQWDKYLRDFKNSGRYVALKNLIDSPI